MDMSQFKNISLITIEKVFGNEKENVDLV